MFKKLLFTFSLFTTTQTDAIYFHFSPSIAASGIVGTGISSALLYKGAKKLRKKRYISHDTFTLMKRYIKTRAILTGLFTTVCIGFHLTQSLRTCSCHYVLPLFNSAGYYGFIGLDGIIFSTALSASSDYYF